jgi:two-component system NtrC family sensor kinase
MASLNLRQKMVGCFLLHMLFHIIVGITFLADFELFNDDVNLLMHAGNLSNICLEIRRYEKNFLIRHDNEDFEKVLSYINAAQIAVPEVIDDLKLMVHPIELKDFSAKLAAYKQTFLDLKEQCTTQIEIIQCPARLILRDLGQELVGMTEKLVLDEQLNMKDYISNFNNRLAEAILFLGLLSIFTVILLYTSIITPLQMVENAAIGVSNGTFSLLPMTNEKGEVRRVLEAFNKMVTDLDEHQKQLFHAKKLSSIGTLASGTAHQINNPLNNISTSCQLALADIDEKENPFVVKMLKTINQETQRAGEIVRGLLEFSRAQSFSLQPCSLFNLVKKVSQLVASEIPAGIVLNTDIPKDIMVFIDAQKLTEALLNLTINAIQAIPSPPGSVFIYAKIDADNRNAVITFADTGTGIDEKNLPQIFDPFFTTKNAEDGTGLGLAVVYGIIEKLNGAIRVESELGKGTKFLVDLPLYADPTEADMTVKS